MSYAVRLAKLPLDAPTLSFRTLQNYGDGRVDRWIEVPQPGKTEPESPAPTFEVVGATGAAPTAESPAAPAPQAAEPASEDSSGGNTSGMVTVLAVVVVVAVAGVVLMVRERRKRT